MRISHLILDTYDLATDPAAGTKLAAAGFDSTKLAKLPDRLFALVADNEGEVLRKYAMHDAAHVRSSVDTFLEYGSVLPSDVQGIVAENLVRGCGWYDIEVPAKLASLYDQSGFDLDKAKAIGTKASGPASGGASIPGVLGESSKEADLTGSLDMPVTMNKSAPYKKRSPDIINPNTNKHAGDLTGYEPPTPAPAPYVPTHYALPSEQRYPLDIPDHVIKAASYFDEWSKFLAPAQRREFAVNTVKRAEAFALPVTDKLAAYAGSELGERFEDGIRQRVERTEGEAAVAYEQLKTAALGGTYGPEVVARALSDLDEANGLDAAYDRPFVGIDDPYYTCFGMKVAETYVWSGGGVSIDEQGIRELTLGKGAAIARAFGDDVAKALKEDPVSVFDSLPEPQKVTLAKMARES